MAVRPQLDAGHDRIQSCGKQLILYVYSLMKTGEVHELNNEAWYRPTEKLVDALDTLIKIERQAITFIIQEGVVQVNSHALWLDSNTTEQANELEQLLARREAGGIMFLEVPPEQQVKHFFHMFARFKAPDDAEDQMAPLQDVLGKEGVTKLKLAPAPLRLQGVGQGVRGVTSLWYYAKCSAGMALTLAQAPVEVKAARRVAQELVDACATEQDFACALPLLGSDEPTPARRAVDIGIYCAATARGLGLSTIHCADLTAAGLLHVAGHAYQNPDPAAFTIPELVGSMALKQLVEGSKFGAGLGQRVAAAVESGIGADKSGPPYIVGAPDLMPSSQLVALAREYVERCRGERGHVRASPTQVALDLLEAAPAHIDPNLVKVFVATVGLLPVGTVVELMTGDLGVVVDVDHLRGRTLYRKSPPPVTGRRKVFIERMRDAKDKVVPERKARIELNAATDTGDTWTVTRVLKPDGLSDLITRALIRRPATVIAQLGLKGHV